jgi:hypothetical protein
VVGRSGERGRYREMNQGNVRITLDIRTIDDTYGVKLMI